MKLDIVVNPSPSINGEMEPQPSKYLTMLACAVASLCPNKSVIESPLLAKDTSAMVKACEVIGCIIKRSQGKWSMWGVERGFTPVQPAIDLKNSETALSLMSAVVSFSKIPMVLTGDANMCKRGMPDLLEALRKMGIKIHSANPEESPPLLNFGGEIHGGRVDLTKIPERFISPALLLASRSTKNVEILTSGEKFRFQTNRTVEIMKKGGCGIKMSSRKILVSPGPLKPINYRIPAELCSAAPFIIASGILNSQLIIKSQTGFSQRDGLFANALRAFGMVVKTGRNRAKIKGGPLKGASVDLSWGPELFPFFAVMACCARGTTKIRGVSEARKMKSDRVTTIVHELKKMGARILDREDSVVIRGPCELTGGEVEGWNDHAVAAALAVAGLRANKKTVIKGGAEALGTSYSKFISTFKTLGANMGYSG